MQDNTVTLKVNGQTIGGWEDVRITRGLERSSSDFQIKMSERYPGEFAMEEVTVKPGDYCVVMIGGDPAVTGYVDQIKPAISANEHSTTVIGRGKCADLADTSAEWPGGQIVTATVLAMAQKLAAPYTANGGIQVTADAPEVGLPIPVHIVNFGETPYDIIENTCRYRALLAYELPNGNLHLSRAGTARAASCFKLGVNVQSAALDLRADQRYSTYTAQSVSVNVFADEGNGGYLSATVTDPGVTRHRLKYIISEQGFSSQDALQARALWEMNRRIGRSQKVTLTTDGWRDSAGALYAINTLAHLDMSELKVSGADWLICEVSYRMDATSGMTADLVLMPQSAFLVALPTVTKFGDILSQVQDGAGSQ